MKARLLGTTNPGPVGNPFVDGHGALNVYAAATSGPMNLNQSGLVLPALAGLPVSLSSARPFDTWNAAAVVRARPGTAAVHRLDVARGGLERRGLERLGLGRGGLEPVGLERRALEQRLVERLGLGWHPVDRLGVDRRGLGSRLGHQELERWLTRRPGHEAAPGDPGARRGVRRWAGPSP